MATIYPWIKAAHIVSVIAWMAGLLYLPRLFVYHCAAHKGSDQSETFKVMERRLLKGIMTPAMIASWVFGLSLAWILGWAGGWLHMKIALVLVLTGFHIFLARQVGTFAADQNKHAAGFFRAINEIPAVIMLVVVVLVVVKPF